VSAHRSVANLGKRPLMASAFVAQPQLMRCAYPAHPALFIREYL
jgi:hypothetical protein